MIPNILKKYFVLYKCDVVGIHIKMPTTKSECIFNMWYDLGNDTTKYTETLCFYTIFHSYTVCMNLEARLDQYIVFREGGGI